jgi:hypothetical protein
MERNHMQQPAIPELQKKRFPARDEVNTSGKLPGAKQQFRIPFRPELLEQLSFSVLSLSLCSLSLSWLPFPPSLLPSLPPFTPARGFPLMARRSTQPDLVALVACTPSSCPVSLPSRRHSKMDKPRADSAPCLPALAKTERRKFDRISFVLPSLLIRFVSFLFFILWTTKRSVTPIVA